MTLDPVIAGAASARGETVLTIGETMILFDPEQNGAPALDSRFQLRFGGAESNFAIAMARLGRPSRWLSRLGSDHFGALILEQLRREGVDVSGVVSAEVGATGLLVKWRGHDGPGNAYYRRGSAASALGVADLPADCLRDVAAVHLTGITTALGDSARELVHDLARRAHRAGIPVSFDPNYRPGLWSGDPVAAFAAHRELLPFITWYLCGQHEAAQLLGTDEPAQICAALEGGGVTRAVVRVGAAGAATLLDGVLVTITPDQHEDVRDEVGAGDGFDAGFVWAWLEGMDPLRCLQAGNAVAASALRGTGDWESYAGREHVLECLSRPPLTAATPVLATDPSG